MSFTVLVSATSARAPSSNIPHQFRKHSPLITSEALNLPPPPPPSAGTHSQFKGRFSVTRNEFKMHFYGRNKYLDIDLWLQGYNSVFYIFLWEHIATAASSLWRIWSGITWSKWDFGFFGGCFCVLEGAKRFVSVFTHPNYWRESMKPRTTNVFWGKVFLLLFQIHMHHCCRLQLCFYLFLSMLSHYSSRFQENLWSWGSPCPVVYEIKMKDIMFILILPNRHCSLVEYTVNVVHG